MSKSPTFQELLADFSDRTFVGRHSYVGLFHHALLSPRPLFLILNIYGRAGIGKSTLLGELECVARDYKAVTATTNASQTSIHQVVGHLISQFLEHQMVAAQAPRDDDLQKLSHYFATNLDRLAVQRRVALFFDDYDQTASVVDQWLRDLLLGEFSVFSSQVLFVIASRQPLGRPWTAFRHALHQSELSAFNKEETQAYLRQANIVNPQTVAQMWQLSQGVPRVLARLVSQQAQLGDSSLLWQRGRSHFDAKEYPLALADFSQAIELQPDNDYLYHWRGRTYWETQDHSSALADFTTAIQLQPQRVPYYHWRGLAYRKTQDYLSALADFSQAIQLQPQDGNNYWARGYTYQEAHNYRAAVVDFTKAIELQPENINFYYWRGRSYLGMKDTMQAWADFVRIKDILRQKKQPALHTNGSS